MQLQLHNTNYTTPQLQLQLPLRYTTLHPANRGEVTDRVTTATIVTTANSTAPTTFQSITGFALPSVFHNSQAHLEVAYVLFFDTSATALCGTTGIREMQLGTVDLFNLFMQCFEVGSYVKRSSDLQGLRMWGGGGDLGGQNED